ncbi:hypothetical protein M413DRAFT_448883 [Hebeloma cylindrosporum]|uniref:Uncharacterized protein n=1 Tax=Hebeloma cylindrosporum TaxID=76867 RepID=A0A0C3BXG0_HEBCY|nr:hypothetical protein M413DRAFT_448883 [Hebeloma cylindrosporum h7]
MTALLEGENNSSCPLFLEIDGGWGEDCAKRVFRIQPRGEERQMYGLNGKLSSSWHERDFESRKLSGEFTNWSSNISWKIDGSW